MRGRGGGGIQQFYIGRRERLVPRCDSNSSTVRGRVKLNCLGGGAGKLLNFKLLNTKDSIVHNIDPCLSDCRYKKILE